ncbi:uncharacterized protein LOC112459311 [Temnothorax curvispinosus]|uniref:Uncharacterized protein LOC112459311 n=1 Tax=Temnothorax curvispinosus TaxID=300111 RepID=A0A6J1QCR0_9HYME|nr:uncharacterized protein LOC112459311 [Temnothorax curvispinosus]
MCSSYTAEAFAVMVALRLLLCQIEKRAKDMVILSDCKSVLMSIRSNILDVYRNQYIIEARRILFELCYKHERRVVLVWIPSHKGILGNELADALAKEASTEEADPTIVVPLSDMMSSIIRKDTWETTQSSIMAEAAYKGAFYFSNFYERRATKPWFSKLDKERYFITWINRVRANHFNLGSSLKRKGYVDSERCDCGHEREDLNHVILQCRHYDELRIKMDRDLRAIGFLEEIDIIKLIKRKNWKVLNIIFQFIKSTKRII